MTDTLDATVRSIAAATQFSHADVMAAIDVLQASSDDMTPNPAIWAGDQLSDLLPALAAMAAQPGRSLSSVAWGVRRTAGDLSDHDLPTAQPTSGSST